MKNGTSKYLKAIAAILMLSFAFDACTEPFEVETTDFENILVIDATITDELKTQEIILSRTYPSDGENVFETGAMVSVMDGANSYAFEEVNPGIYQSTIEFEALPGRDYILTIETKNGETYISSPQTLPPSAVIDQINAVRSTNNDGDDGVAISVNTVGQNGSEGFYRYEYEETYKIVSFFNPSKDLVIVSENPPELALVDKTREEQICYGTNQSNSITIASAENLEENRVNDVEIRFISRTNRLVAHRYSILVKQLSQSREAFDFYQTLQEFSGIESVFSQTQPGFIVGNISSAENSSQKVLGIFEVASVAQERYFFSFEDVFDRTDTKFLQDCPSEGFPIDSPELFQDIKSGLFKYTKEDPPFIYNIAPVQCVDCNVIGTNQVPDFWIE